MGKKSQRFAAGLILTFLLLFAFNNCGQNFQVRENEVTSLEMAQTPTPPPSPTPSASPSPSASPAAQSGCRAPRHYRYVLPPGQEKFLLCGSGNAQAIWDLSVPDTGLAVARASVVFKNNNALVTHFWNVSVIVGQAVSSYSVGDDVCPNMATGVKQILGYGRLTAANSKVRVQSYQGASPCTDKSIAVWSGAYLDIWVEDDGGACAGKDIQFASYYRNQLLNAGSATANLWNWSTTMEPLHTLSVTKNPDRNQLLVLSSVEGTPAQDPNTVCGSEAATLVSQHAVQGLTAAQKIEPVPASQGMGHLVLSGESTWPLANLNPSFTVQLLLGSNFAPPPTTGGCCGDGTLAVIQTGP